MAQDLPSPNESNIKKLSTTEVLVQAMLFAGMAGLLVLSTAGILYAMEFQSQILPAIISGAVVFKACVLTLVASLLFGQGDPQKTAMAFLMGMLLRMGLCLAIVYLIQQSRPEMSMSFASWMIAWYLIGLLLETLMVIRTIPQESGSKTKIMEEAS